MNSFRKLLSKVPADLRTRFLETMVFANGKLVNIRTGEVGGSLQGGDLVALMQSCGCTTEGYACSSSTAGECVKLTGFACDAAACKGKQGATPVNLDTLLQGVPLKSRQQFLHSLDFEHGHITSADTHVLEGHIPHERMKQLPHVGRRETTSGD